jgi:cobalamin biosynthesis Mg chelatase CobN
MKKIIILSVLVAVSFVALGQVVYADTSTLSVLPASSSSNIGAAFNVSVQLNPASNKVCVVQGTLNFDNLACKSITVASGVMAQIAPTCSSPSFMLGIPGCATAVQNFLSASVAGIQAGQASLSVTGIDLIGTSADVPSSSQPGTYNITAAAVKPAQKPVQKVVAQPTAQPAVQPVTQPVAQPQQEAPAPVEQSLEVGQQASLATASSAKTVTIVIVVILAIIIIGGVWYMFGKKKNKQA